jgi:hypothetical protein
MGAAPALSIAAEPDTAIDAKTKAGIATPRPNAAANANREIIITVSNSAGLTG